MLFGKFLFIWADGVSFLSKISKMIGTRLMGLRCSTNFVNQNLASYFENDTDTVDPVLGAM